MKKVLYLALILICQFTTLNAQNLLTDLRPGLDGSEPAFDAAFQRNNDLFFIANPDGLTSRLYKTNGASGNTVLIAGGSNLYVTMILGFLGDDLLFVAGDVTNGGAFELYKTDGLPGNAELVSSYNQGNDLFIAYPMTITLNGVMYFYGTDGLTGYELWRTDGTDAGTYLVKDINPGNESSLIVTTTSQYFEELNGFIYFGAAEPINGAELWRSDGTEAGTTMVANIDTSEAVIANMGSNPAYLCKYNNAIYFSAYRPVDGRELWKTDGTGVGTTLVKDLAAGDGSPSQLIRYNGLLYFTAFYPNQNYTLYKSDGTTAGTVVVEAPNSGGPTVYLEDKLVVFKGKLYFAASDNQGIPSIWYSDGTASGTSFLPHSPSPYTTYPLNLLATTNYLYFMAYDDTNGNTNTGVFRTTEFPNQNTLLTAESFDANDFQPMYLVDSCLLVRGDDNSATGEEIYTICAQNTQTIGLNEMTFSEMSVYPNPCLSAFSIETSFNVNEVLNLALYNLSGQSVDLPYSVSNQHTIEVNGLSDFQAGVYFLSVRRLNGEVKQIKLMIE